MTGSAGVLSRVKYWASRPLPPKVYWYLMGRFKPVQAVTSSYDKVEDCLASGTEVVGILDALGVIRSGAATLHIGSGLGRVEYHLRERVHACYGVDISASMVKRATELVPFPNVRFFCTEGTDLDRWPNGFFDLIYSFLVFQHLPRDRFEGYVDAAFAKLDHGGHFVFQLMIDETGSAPEPPTTHPYGLRKYQRVDVEALLAAAGFTTVVRTDLHGNPDDGSSKSGDVVFCAAKGEPASGSAPGAP